MSKINLNDLISELVEEELEEASTSVGVPGYQTPYAFSKKKKKGKRKKGKVMKGKVEVGAGGHKKPDVFGYTLVSEEIEAKDYKLLAQIIRMELASIYYDLYKKKSIWT